MAGTKTLNNPFKEMTHELKKNLFVSYFTTGNMTTGSFDDKLELYRLVCYVSHNFNKQHPMKYPSTLNVLESILKREIDTSVDANGFDNMLEGLSIVCDDLLYGIETIQRPEGYENGTEMINKIKILLEQWTAF